MSELSFFNRQSVDPIIERLCNIIIPTEDSNIKSHLPKSFIDEPLGVEKKDVTDTSDKEYELRFAIVVLMQYFIDEDHIDAILQIYDNIRHDGYYVKMAVAWAISVCFVKFRDKTLEFLKYSNLDDFTYNKSLQKVRESNRVSKEDKDMVKRMRR